MRNKKNESDYNMSVLDMCINGMGRFIEEGHHKQGSSVTTSLAELEIGGINYQVQIRLEKDEDYFIDEDSISQAVTLGEV